MDRKVLILGVILVLVLFLLLGLAFKKTNECSKEKTQIEKDNCLMEKAIETLDKDLCKEIKTTSFFVSTDACYGYISQETKDGLLCEKIQQQELKENCYENIE